jgi:hypothetical protein
MNWHGHGETSMKINIAVLFALIAASDLPVTAQNLSLTIGNPVAAPEAGKKVSAQFAFRINGCADLATAQVAASAEGFSGSDGARRSIQIHPIPVRTVPNEPPAMYLIASEWGAGGKWVVVITASCQDRKAGAIVPVTSSANGGSGFVRESTQYFSHAPSPAEAEAALNAYTAAPQR